MMRVRANIKMKKTFGASVRLQVWRTFHTQNDDILSSEKTLESCMLLEDELWSYMDNLSAFYLKIIDNHFPIFSTNKCLSKDGHFSNLRSKKGAWLLFQLNATVQDVDVDVYNRNRG